MHWTRRFRDVALAPTARDKQRRVGPSNLSNPCARCLAHDLLGVEENDNPFVMGSWIGTAIHERLEKLILDSSTGWIAERKLYIGELGSYGPIKGTSDLYIPEEATVVDFKTTTRDKLKGLLDEDSFKSFSYVAQLHLYGLGVENLGDPVRNLTIVYIPRDSVTWDDIRFRTVAYDREYAEHVLQRGLDIWEWLEDGGDPDTLEKTPGCFTCDYTHNSWA